jgi:peptide deformylase
MSVCPVLPWPHPLLLKPSGEVQNFDAHIERLCRDLHDTAVAAEAPMMSAVQIGAAARVIYISNQIAGQPLMLINPVVEQKSALLQHHQEACASLPGIVIDIWRSASITIAAKNIRGDAFAFNAEGTLAQAIQHELNHLDGKTMIECAKKAKRWFYRERMAKYGGASGGVLDYRQIRAA